MTLQWFWQNRDKLPYSLNQLYHCIGLSKQAFHDWLNHRLHKMDEYQQLLPLIRDIREEHPQMSSRTMYRMIKPEFLGRDKFIEMSAQNGFKIIRKRNQAKTTDSRGVTKFPNRIKDLMITNINQVWVSDITYYAIGDRFYYITLIMDFKSRYIVGYHVSNSLRTEQTTLPALKMAMGRVHEIKGLILHSDGGGQYYCKEFLELTRFTEIINSMTEDTGENNHAERINGTIKNQYLSSYMPTNFTELKKQLTRAVNNYNLTRPHKSLKYDTPATRYLLSTEIQVINKEKRTKKESTTIIIKV